MSHDIIKQNYTWWKTRGAKSKDNPFVNMDRDEIIKENNYFSSIVELNRYVITTDSQKNMNENKEYIPHIGFMVFMSRRDGFDIEDLKKTPIIESHQVPYIECYMPQNYITPLINASNANKLDFEISIVSRKQYVTSSKKSVHQLTYYKLKNKIKNGDKMTEYLFPTNFRNSEDIYRDHYLSELQHNSSLSNMAKLIMIGRNSDQSIDSIIEQFIDTINVKRENNYVNKDLYILSQAT